MKTAKFGGTSLADAARFRQVKRIVSADPELRFVVVSAPGKRSAEDKKVTDLLYDCHAAVKTGADPETAFAPVAARFRQIVQELDLAIDLESELRQIEAALASGASAAYCASRGEYLSGRMIVQGTREINITVGISEPEYEKAVHAVHGEFFPEAPQ